MNVITSNVSILLVDDNIVDLGAAERTLRKALPTAFISTAQSKQAALDLLSNNKFDVVVADYELGDGNGLEIKEVAGDAVIILVTGAGSEKVAVQALRLGVDDYLIKDLNSSHLQLLLPRIEKALRQRDLERTINAQAEIYFSIIDAAPMPMMLYSDEQILHVNQSFYSLFGYTATNLPSLSEWRRIVIADDAKLEEAIRRETALSAAVSNKSLSTPPRQYSIRTARGSEVSTLIYLTKLVRPKGYTLVTYVDMTAQIEAAKQNAALLELLRHTETAARIGSWEIDIATGQETWSPELRRIFDVDEAVPIESTGRLESYYEADRARMLALRHQAIETGEGWDIEIKRTTQTGRQIWVRQVCKVVQENGRTTKLVGYTQDITERKILSERASRIEKLSAVGQLAGGVAHDINNNLSIISGSAELILNKAIPESAVHKLTDRILTTVDRCASLTKKLLGFSRQSPINPTTFNLVDVLHHMRDTLERTLGAGIKVQVFPVSGDFIVRLDRNLLENCIINLSVNARDAMPHGGILTFEARSEVTSGAMGPHSWVTLTVSDTGTGMSREVLDKIFEPFFTTKRPGKGTGLGLATVFGFVKQSEGEISVDSVVGVGTSFHIRIPCAEQVHTNADGPAGGVRQSATMRKTVLITEDNNDLRETYISQLQSLGYETLSASSFDQAVGLIRAGKRPDFILTDHDLGGGATGIDLMEWVGKEELKIPGAVITGLATFDRASVDAQGWKILEKPATLREITSIISESAPRTSNTGGGVRNTSRGDCRPPLPGLNWPYKAGLGDADDAQSRANNRAIEPH